ncbi:MAG: alpha-L-rhamnosidase C-terminal domain-containing protein [Acidobacteriaceae bacterium]
MKPTFQVVICSFALLLCPAFSTAQTSFSPGQLDPTRNIASPQPGDQGHTPLPEQYIWTPEQTRNQSPAQASAKRYFRAVFRIGKVPQNATLYVAGVDSSVAYVNGKLADKVEANPASDLSMTVFATNVKIFLHPGKNVVALQVVGGDHNLIVKVVPRAKWLYASPLLISGPDWKCTLQANSGWQDTDFDDSTWVPVRALGPIESSIDFFQWGADTGLYNWPGYIGVSRFLARATFPAMSVQDVFRGRSSYDNLDALTQLRTGPGSAHEFTVHLSATTLPQQEAPSLLLDFGREMNGRIRFVSDSNESEQVTVQYGESKDEAEEGPYFGVDLLTIPAHQTGYGPKSAFRYAKIRFIGGGPVLRFQSIDLDDIYYPVQYRGSFESSDPLLNRIWEVGAYTAHLCMQEDIWDAPKRDRGRWAGDLEVSSRVINDVFADHFLMQDTMTRLIGDAPIKAHVNHIPGYSASWISEETQYYLHNGSLSYLQGLHERLVQLLNYMDTDLNAENLYVNKTKAWPFVDWSPDLHSDTPEARRATQFEFYLAYRDGAFLLRQLGDTANAEHFEQRAALLKEASQKYLLDSSADTYGPRWQTNAMAVFSGVADPSQYAPIWDRVLSTVDTTKYTALVMTPYYNYYIISAMAETGHRARALGWIRKYWGGMIAEGATSFWEGYYPSWPKANFHTSLQADDGSGYYVSLAHGWSAGPTAWLMEQILGIQPTAGGFSEVTIRPDLVGLSWAKGAEPTPHGLLQVSLRQAQGLETVIDVPAGVKATVLVPITHSSQRVLVNGNVAKSVTTAEDGTRAAVILQQPGHYELHAE